MDDIKRHASLSTAVAAVAVLFTSSTLSYHYISRSSKKNEYREIPLAKGSMPYFGKKKESNHPKS